MKSGRAFFGEWLSHLLTGAILTLSMLIQYDGPWGLEAMVAGTAYRPFVYRVLSSAVIKVLALATRLPLEAALLIAQLVWLMAFSKIIWELAGLTERRRLAWLVTVVGVMPLTAKTPHIYDAPTIALWSLTLLLMLRRKWPGMVCAYTLACLSKETAILLVPVFIFNFYDKWPRRNWVGLSGLLAVIWAGSHLAVMWAFRHNPGGELELHAIEQMAHYPRYAAETCVIGALLVWSWKRQPEFFRRALIVSPVFVVFFLVTCWSEEWRDLGEIYPVVALMLANALSMR